MAEQEKKQERGSLLEQALKDYVEALKAKTLFSDTEPFVSVRPPEKRSRFKKN